MYRLCKSYDEISDKVQEMPDNTSDLVALTQFLENASSVTVVNLQTAVDEAGERLLFLLDYATLPCMFKFFLVFFFKHFQKGWVLVRVILKKLVGDCVLTVVKCNA